MENICSEENCTGCSLCVNICPVNAISMELNEEGFYFPRIIKDKCINCGKCIKGCQANPKKQSPLVAYKANSNDLNVLLTSTSGGLFVELAKKILKEGGRIFGAIFNEDFSVKHIEIGRVADLAPAQGSKYIGSRIDDAYTTIKNLLKNKLRIAFFGTPCQCAALKKFIGIEDENLLLCDFVCHGVASEKLFKHFLRNLEMKEGSDIKEFYFRSKDFGYTSPNVKVVYKNAKVEYYPTYDCSFGYAFAAGMINRKSCARCEFATFERCSDITICDLTYSISEDEKNRGVSLCLINSNKGGHWLEGCDIEKEEVSFDFCKKAQYHLTKAAEEHRLRYKVFKNIEKLPYEQLAKKYMSRPKNTFINKIKTKLLQITRRREK